MANLIQAEHGTSTALTITLASLATSTTGVGRQSTLVSNVDDAQLIHLYGKITTGTSPTDKKTIAIYFLKGDGTIRTDNAGASDAAHTVLTADLIKVIPTNSTSNVTYYWDALVRNPGPEWGVTVVHDTAVNLHATAGNHAIYYVTENPEVQ